MPSYRYLRDIKPEDLVNPDGTLKEYTKKEKFANWWHYHWYFVLGGLVVVGLVVFFVVDAMRQTTPDLQMAILTETPLPTELGEVLGEQLSPYVRDVDGDGEQTLMVEVYTMSPAVSEEEALAEVSSVAPADMSQAMEQAAQNPYEQMAGVTKMSTAVQLGEPALFLISPLHLADADSETAITGTLEGGTLPQGATLEDNTIAIEDVVEALGLDLHYEAYGSNWDGLQDLKGYRLGILPSPTGGERNQKDRAAAWQESYDFLQALKTGTPAA